MANKIKLLDFSEVAKGIKISLDNAKDLIGEANILHDRKRFRGSLVFALFSWEECAKIEQIFNLLEPVEPKNAQKKWNDFRKKFLSHEKKLISSFTAKIIADIEKTDGKEIKGFIVKDKKIEDVPDLVRIKETYLYVNCDFKKKKFIPPYIISEDISKGIINDVNAQLKIYEQFNNCTTEKIEEALKQDAGEEYWEERPFDVSSRAIKNKLQRLIETA